MENLKDILKELQKIRLELKLQYDDNCLLDCGTRIFNAQSINANSKEDTSNKKLLTDKQKNTLIGLGYQGEGLNKLSSKEAHYIIKELINKNEKR